MLKMRFYKVLVCMPILRLLFLTILSIFGFVDVMAQDSIVRDTISRDAQRLAEVTVTASNVIHRGDRDLVYITRDMRKGNFNTAEMLGRVPGLQYNRSTKSLSYYGEENVKILVDSLDKDADYIKGLHHLRFDKLDIIPNPKGKYEGYAVLINLHTKPCYEGYEGTLSTTGEFFPGDRNVRGDIFGDADWNGRFTYTKGKWNYVMSYDGDFSQQERNNLVETMYLLNNYMESSLDMGDGAKNHNEFSRGHVANGSIDYQFDKRNSVSFVYQLGLQSMNAHDVSYLLRSPLVGTNPCDTILSRHYRDENSYRHTFGLFFRGGIGGWNYTTDLNVVFNGWNTESYLQKSSGYVTNDNRRTRMNHTTAKLEASRLFFNRRLYLAIGYNNFWKQYRQDELHHGNRLTDYTLWQNKWWVFSSCTLAHVTTLSLASSIMTNHTRSGIQRDNYLSWNGSLGFFRQLMGNNWVRFEYNCKISNPDMTKVMGYGHFTDSLQWVTGNPLLRSSISHEVNLKYHLLRYFTLNGRYLYQPRTFTDITVSCEGYLENGEWSKYAFTSPQNAMWSSTWLGLYYEQQIGALNLSANVDYRYVTGKYREYAKSVANWTGNCMLEYNVPKASLYLSCAYNLCSDYNAWAQGISKTKMDLLWLNLEKSFFGERLNVSFIYNVPVHFVSGKNISSSTSPAKYVYARNFNYNNLSSNSFEVCVTYRFHGGKSVRQYKRELSDEK